MRAIELLLLWEGRVSRGRLLDLFDVHGTMASRDIAAFRQQYPDVCVQIPEAKAYARTSQMRPSLTAGRFEDYQELIGAGYSEKVAAGVAFTRAQVDITRIGFNDYAVLHGAIREGSGVELTYRSLSTPAPHRRAIRPHSLIQAGPRWHVRAWCAKAQQFREFNLGRISEATAVAAGNMPGADEDRVWGTVTPVRLIPHQALSAPQRQLVRDEYMAGAAALRFDVRVPLVPYLVQAYRAALDPERQLPPEYLLMVDDVPGLPTGAVWSLLAS